jgi:hypothetical protein
MLIAILLKVSEHLGKILVLVQLSVEVKVCSLRVTGWAVCGEVVDVIILGQRSHRCSVQQRIHVVVAPADCSLGEMNAISLFCSLCATRTDYST